MSVPSDINNQLGSPVATDISQVQTITTPSVTRPKKPFGGKQLSRRTKILLLVLIGALLIPTVTVLAGGVTAFLVYNQARSGLTHLQNAQKALSSGGHGDITKYFNINNLHQAQQEIDAAHGDFLAVSNNLDQDNLMGMFGVMLPQQMTTARSLGHMGVDTTE